MEAKRLRLLVIHACRGVHALRQRPRLDERSVDGEVLVGGHLRVLCPVPYPREKRSRNVGSHQPISILGERGVIPRHVIHREPDKPTKPDGVVELFDEHPLTAARDSTCNNGARSSCSGAIEGRPFAAYVPTRPSVAPTRPAPAVRAVGAFRGVGAFRAHGKADRRSSEGDHSFHTSAASGSSFNSARASRQVG